MVQNPMVVHENMHGESWIDVGARMGHHMSEHIIMEVVKNELLMYLCKIWCSVIIQTA